jgi:hypothetical protein
MMTDNLKPYIILYREDNEVLIDPWGYKVMAEDLDHAEEQFYNAEPDCEILWIVETDDYDVALDNYYEENE